MQRQKVLSATALERLLAVGKVREEIFQRGKKKRSKPAFLPIDTFVDFVFDQVGEKALREILRIVHAVSAATHETVQRRPVSLAKLRKRGLRNRRFCLASPRRENRAPVRRRKHIALVNPVR